MQRAAKRVKWIIAIIVAVWLSLLVGTILAAVISDINWEMDRKKHMHGW
jgi:hypothetical protein